MLVLGCAAVSATSVLHAQSKPAAPSKAPAKSGKGAKPQALDVAPIRAAIASNDPTKVAQGLADAQAAGGGAAAVAPAIEDLLKKGSGPETMRAALDALGAIGAPSSSAVLRAYIRHRTPELRRAAARALASTRGPEAAAGLREGLRGPDAIVRGFSATGLGALGNADALADLFVALDHGVTEAAASIGVLCGPEDCLRFGQNLTKVGFDVMTSGFEPILFRNQPLPEDTLLKVVGSIRELGTAEAGKYLADVSSRWPENGSKKVKQALDSAVSAIPGAKGAP